MTSMGNGSGTSRCVFICAMYMCMHMNVEARGQYQVLLPETAYFVLRGGLSVGPGVPYINHQ